MGYPGVFIVLPEWIEACHNAVRFDDDGKYFSGHAIVQSTRNPLRFPESSQEHRVEEADFAVPGLPSVVPPR